MTRDDGSDALLGQVVAGRYRVRSKIAQGGMGAIYLATQEPLGREVALKVLLGNYAQDATAIQRFEQEARAVSRLRHPHIVTLYDFGHIEDERLFIAMEYLDGRSLRQVLDAEGKLSYLRALHIVKGIASGLVEAHRQGTMHRDLKPENVMLVDQAGDSDFVKILDFGLARSVQGEVDSKLTQQNMIPGTPAYMPPERIHGVNDDLRSDLYSLGALWFELLAGRPPFEAESPVKVIVRHLQDPPPRPRDAGADPKMPPSMEALILRLLEKSPERRPPSAEALLDELRQLDTSGGWAVASPHEFAARAMQVPDLSALADESGGEPSLDLDFENALAARLEAELGEEETGDEPIALTQRKEADAEAPPFADTSEEGVVLLTRVKPTAVDDTIDSVTEAAGRMCTARNLLDVARVLVAFLRSRFDRAAVVDLRFPPARILASHGLTDVRAAEQAFDEADAVVRLVARGEAYYGPPLDGPEWEAFHRVVPSAPPGGVLLAALRRNGAPALLVYADHDRRDLYAELKGEAALVREAAHVLTALSF